MCLDGAHHGIWSVNVSQLELVKLKYYWNKGMTKLRQGVSHVYSQSTTMCFYTLFRHTTGDSDCVYPNPEMLLLNNFIIIPV